MTRRVLPVAVVICAAAALALWALAPSRAIRADAASAAAATIPPTALNVALTGTASASSEAAGAPAANAIDGDAATQWCSTQWTGSLTIDLGRVRSVDGFGVTLGATATTALVNLSYGTEPGALHGVPGAERQSVPAGEPVYWPSGDRRLRARYVKIDVTDNDGTPPCIGELRVFERAPTDTIRDRGDDLSFEPQEAA